MVVVGGAAVVVGETLVVGAAVVVEGTLVVGAAVVVVTGLVVVGAAVPVVSVGAVLAVSPEQAETNMARTTNETAVRSMVGVSHECQSNSHWQSLSSAWLVECLESCREVYTFQKSNMRPYFGSFVILTGPLDATR